MNEDRITELEIKLAYQEDLLQDLNKIVAEQQMQIHKLHETCIMLHEKLTSLSYSDRQQSSKIEIPPHY